MKKDFLLLSIFLFCSLSFEKDGAIYGGWRIEHNTVLAESLFSNTKTIWTREFSDSLVNFKSSGSLVAFSKGTRIQRSLHFRDFEKGLDWEISRKDYPVIWYFILGTNDVRIMVGAGLHESLYETNLFDRNGKHLFKLKTTGALIPSPNGVFFYTISSMVSYNMLEVYDSDGKLLWKTNTSSGDWVASAISDSELVYFDMDDFILYSLNSGEQKWKFGRIIKDFSHVVASANGVDFVVFGSNEIISLNRQGEIRWIRNDLGRPYSAAISEDGHFVAVHARNSKDFSKSTLSLLDNREGGRTIWVRDLDEGHSNFVIESLKFYGSYIRLMPKERDYFYGGGITEDMKTYIYEINENNGKLVSSHVLPGNIQLIEENEEVIGYYQLRVISDKKVISRVEVVP